MVKSFRSIYCVSKQLHEFQRFNIMRHHLLLVCSFLVFLFCRQTQPNHVQHASSVSPLQTTPIPISEPPPPQSTFNTTTSSSTQKNEGTKSRPGASYDDAHENVPPYGSEPRQIDNREERSNAVNVGGNVALAIIIRKPAVVRGKNARKPGRANTARNNRVGPITLLQKLAQNIRRRRIALQKRLNQSLKMLWRLFMF